VYRSQLEFCPLEGSHYLLKSPSSPRCSAFMLLS
jgi:hypothetical protein